MSKSHNIYAKRNSPLTERLSLYAKPDPSGCTIWTKSRDRFGYGYASVKGRRIYMHRFAWETVNGPIPAGLCALHKCDNPPCCNPDHLFIGTRRDNNADKMAKGRQSHGEPHAHRGSSHGHAKLTEQDVIAIRRDWISHESVAARYGVSASLISMIRARKIWTHI
jgi:hypothetical protein